jgi:hypothetical protein
VKTVLCVAALVPVGVDTVTKYVVPTIADGDTAVIEVEELTATLGERRTTLSLVGTPPDSSTKLTVDPATNPVPVSWIEVPPMIDPPAGEIDVTDGTFGSQTQLATVIVVPQYVKHCAWVGGLMPGG